MREIFTYIFTFIIGWTLGWFTFCIRDFFLEEEDDNLIR